MAEQTFRTARVFDGTGNDGRPHVDRQMLDETEAGKVLAYLQAAPVVTSAQGLAPDRIDPHRGDAVPRTWQTDGSWVWPGAVTYYLRSYALPPDPDFLEHIRQRHYRPPTVDGAARQAASAVVNTPAPAGPPPQQPARPRSPAATPVLDTPAAEPPKPHRAPADPVSARGAPGATAHVPGAAARGGPVPGSPVPGVGGPGHGGPGAGVRSFGTPGTAPLGARTPRMPAPAVPAASRSAQAMPAQVRPTLSTSTPGPSTPGPSAPGSPMPGPSRPGSAAPGSATPGAPMSGAPSSRTPAATSRRPAAGPGAGPAGAAAGRPHTHLGSSQPPADDSTSFDRLRAAAVELGLSTKSYRVGAAAEGAWSVLREGTEWAVFRSEHGARHELASFASSHQAAAYLIGQLYLSRGQLNTAVPDSPAAAVEPAPEHADEQPAHADSGTTPVVSPSRGEQPEQPTEQPEALSTDTDHPVAAAEPAVTEDLTATEIDEPAGSPVAPADTDQDAETTSDSQSDLLDDPRPAADADQDALVPADTHGADAPELTEPEVDATADADDSPHTAQTTPGDTAAGPPATGHPGPGLTAATAGTDPVASSAGQQPHRSGDQAQPPADRRAAAAAESTMAMPAPTPITGPQPVAADAAADRGGELFRPMQPATLTPAPPLPPVPPVASPRSAAPQPQPPAPQQPAAQPQPAQAQPAQQWQIHPLAGEPPLTLYRDKRLVLLPPGTEIDRYGEASGNVAYEARTRYEARSLPAEWGSFPYHVYRLQRPLEALTGLAVPWFEQPGGGTVFVLPRSIAELVTDGVLVEIESSAPGS